MVLSQLNICLTPYTMNSRWSFSLNMKGKTGKLLKGNMGEYLHDLGVSRCALDRTEKR